MFIVNRDWHYCWQRCNSFHGCCSRFFRIHDRKVCLAPPLRVRRKSGHGNEPTSTTSSSVRLVEPCCSPTESSRHSLIRILRQRCSCTGGSVSIQTLKVSQLDYNICHNDRQSSTLWTSISRILALAVARANCGGHTWTVPLLQTTRHTKMMSPRSLRVSRHPAAAAAVFCQKMPIAFTFENSYIDIWIQQLNWLHAPKSLFLLSTSASLQEKQMGSSVPIFHFNSDFMGPYDWNILKWNLDHDMIMKGT